MKSTGDSHSSTGTRSLTLPPAAGATPNLPQERLAAAALLRLLSNQRLPVLLTTDEQMEAAATLVPMGHVQATIRLVPCPCGGFPRAAVVISKIICRDPDR
jgi:hypothetical protein